MIQQSTFLNPHARLPLSALLSHPPSFGSFVLRRRAFFVSSAFGFFGRAGNNPYAPPRAQTVHPDEGVHRIMTRTRTPGAEDTVSDGGGRRAARIVGDNLVDKEETAVSNEESSNAVFVDLGRTL